VHFCPSLRGPLWPSVVKCMADRPNILFIMSDEHDAANMGCYGDPLGATPNLDALADRGVTFNNCYCNSPLCVPSRLSFTAGQYISRFGGWNNDSWLPSNDYPSLPGVLNAAGYQSYLCGKQHYDTTRRYGFTDILPDVESRQGSNHNHKAGKGDRRPADATENRQAVWINRSNDFYVTPNGRVLDHDRAVTHTTRGFLAGRSNDDPPFFLFAGYVAPHFPLQVPLEYADRFYGKTPPPIGRPNWEPITANGPTFNHDQLRLGFGVVDADTQVERRGRDLYWALTAWFDNEVGKVLKALDNSDVAENTIVIYTSDHGEDKGDHGLWWKNCMYDHGARVPLIVSWPKRWTGGQRRTSVCSLVDVVRTIIELGDAEAHPDMDGDSMLGYLDDESNAFKDWAVSEYYSHPIASGFVMYREGKWKYVYHTKAYDNHGPARELYDMHADPQELTNLADDPAHADRIAAMHQSMVDELGEEPDDTEQRCRADFAKGYDR